MHSNGRIVHAFDFRSRLGRHSTTRLVRARARVRRMRCSPRARVSSRAHARGGDARKRAEKCDDVFAGCPCCSILSPASASPSPRVGFKDDERTNPARLFSSDGARGTGRRRRSLTRGGMDADGGVFARGGRRARWGAMTPNAFAETTTAPSVEAARRRSKTRSAVWTPRGWAGLILERRGTRSAAGGGGGGRGRGRRRGRRRRRRWAGIISRLRSRYRETAVVFTVLRRAKLWRSSDVDVSVDEEAGEGRDGSLGSSWGSRRAADDGGGGGALSRMNSLAETKVLTSTLLIDRRA